jgi:hypothetical protein
MNSRRFLVGIAILTAIAGAGVVPASASPKTSWIHDGFYTWKIGSGTADVKLTVVDNGTEVEMGTKTTNPTSPVVGGVECIPSPSFVATNPSEFSSTRLTTVIMYNDRISPSGTFSFSGNMSIGSATTYAAPLTLSGHFVRGTIVPGKTIAVVGTLSAPQTCAASTPTTFKLVWK